MNFGRKKLQKGGSKFGAGATSLSWKSEKITIYFPKKGAWGSHKQLGNFPEIHPFWRIPASLREACPYHYRWIFGKVPKGGEGVISDPKKFVAKFLALETTIWGGHFRSKKFRRKKSQHFSWKKGGEGGVKGRSKDKNYVRNRKFDRCELTVSWDLLRKGKRVFWLWFWTNERPFAPGCTWLISPPSNWSANNSHKKCWKENNKKKNS